MVWAKSAGDLNDPHGGFFTDLKSRRAHKGQSLLITFFLKEDYGAPIQIGRKEEYVRREEWVNFSRSEIAKMGYTQCEGLKDSLAWWGVPIYCRFIGGRTAMAEDLQTATTLNDRMRSHATRDFIKGLFKGSLPAMDIQKIGLLAILGVGAILGMWWLGVF